MPKIEHNKHKIYMIEDLYDNSLIIGDSLDSTIIIMINFDIIL